MGKRYTIRYTNLHTLYLFKNHNKITFLDSAGIYVMKKFESFHFSENCHIWCPRFEESNPKSLKKKFGSPDCRLRYE